MLKRKRQEDDGRSRAPPRHSVATRLRRALAELGEPSKIKLEVAIQQLADDIVEVDDEAREPLLQMTRALVYEQPHKIQILASLVELVSERAASFAQAVIDMTHDELGGTLKSGEYGRLKVFLRFACALSIVGADSLLVILEQLASRAADVATTPLGRQLYTAVVLAVIYLANTGTIPSKALEDELARFDPGDLSGATDRELPFFGSGAPYAADPIVVHIKRAAEHAKEHGWTTDFLLKLQVGTSDLNRGKFRFPLVHVPPADSLVPWKNVLATVPDAIKLRTLVYTPTKYETLPSPDSLFGVLIRDISGDNIDRMDFNRKEVTRQLITLDLFFNPQVFAPPGISFDVLGDLQPGKSTWKVEDVALEGVLEKMLQLPLSDFPTVYYDTVLIEACVMAPQAIAPVLGRALRFFFTNLETIDVELFWRIVDWFSHHVSNFGFTWKWNEWVDALTLPSAHPMQVFMRELILKQIRLSYPQRVKDVLPEEFWHLVPAIPEVPAFPYEGDALVEELVLAIQGPPATASEKMAQVSERTTQENIGKEVVVMEKSLARILAMAVCHLGNRSISHANTWIKRSAPLIADTIPDKTKLIEPVLEYWKDTVWVGMLVLDKFVANGLIEPMNIVEFIFDNRDLLLSAAGWETLLKYWQYVEPYLYKLDKTEDWSGWWDERLRKALSRRIDAEATLEKSRASSASSTDHSANKDVHSPPDTEREPPRKIQKADDEAASSEETPKKLHRAAEDGVASGESPKQVGETSDDAAASGESPKQVGEASEVPVVEKPQDQEKRESADETSENGKLPAQNGEHGDHAESNP